MANKLEYLLTIKDEASQTLQKFKSVADDTGSSTGKLSDMFAGATKASQTFSKVVAAAKVVLTTYSYFAVKAYTEQEEQLTKLNTILLNNTANTQENFEALVNQGKALEKTGVISGGVTMALQAQLATFDLLGTNIEKITPALLDMMIAEKGANATTADAIAIGQMMGNVYKGQYASLLKMGFEVTEAQKKMIEFGDETQKTQAVFEILGGTYEGLNEKMRATFGGQLQVFKNNMNDLHESIGRVISERMKPMLTNFNYWWEETKKTEGAIKLLNSSLDWLGDNIAIVAGGLAGGLALALGAIAVAFGVVLIKIAAFVAAGAAIMAVVDNVVNKFGGWSNVLGDIVSKTERIAIEERKLHDMRIGFQAGMKETENLRIRHQQALVNEKIALNNAQKAEEDFQKAQQKYVEDSPQYLEAQKKHLDAQVLYEDAVGTTTRAEDALRKQQLEQVALADDIEASSIRKQETMNSLTGTIEDQWNAWDRLKNKISEAMGFAKEFAKQYWQNIGDTISNLPGTRNILDLVDKVKGYALGGNVDRTGMAKVHAGEFVLSNDMLAGRQNIPERVRETINESTQNISVNAVINTPLDVYSLANTLGSQLAFAGR